jgi:diacylglycerol kinase family enzyme
VPPVDATALVAPRLRSGTRRRINVGRIRDRHFLFCAGMGLDADVVRHTEAQPDKKRRWGKWMFLKDALRLAATEYRGAAPAVTMKVEGQGGEPDKVLTAVFANARPFTYFGPFPVDACPQAHLDERLDALGITKIRLGSIPRLAWALLASRRHVRWRTVRHHHDVARIRLLSDHPMPVQADGDFIGDYDEALVEHVPAALDLLV